LPAPDLFRKLLLLTGVRLLVGTALLVATAVLSFGSGEGFPHRVEVLLYGIIASIYLGSLISIWFLRSRRFLQGIAHAQIAGDIIAASGLVYLTGGAESIFTILYPLAIVNGAIGLSRRGAILAAVLSALSFILLAVGMEQGLVTLPFAYADRVPLPMPRLALTLAANLSAFVLTAALSAHLAGALQGARKELAARETELEQLVALHHNVVQSIASGILTTDGEGRITYLNPYGEEITGLSQREVRGELLGLRFADLASALLPLHGGRGEAFLPDARSGGSRVVGYAVAPLEQAGHVIVLQDLTELRRMEEAVRRADRLAAMGKLAAGLAHEIRNPLASMCGSIEMLGRSPGLAEKDRKLMQIVLREGERLEALVHDFLAFARPPSPQLQLVDVSRLVEETLSVLKQDASAKGLAIEAQLEPNAQVRADPDQLKQVLWNLLTNAAEATASNLPATGPGQAPESSGAVRVRLRRAANHVALEVKDSGAGIAEEDLLRIFDPFFTTKERGTGLGLAIVHRIVEAHGGEIAVDSVPGKGSTFTVRLPFVASAPTLVAAQLAPTPPAAA